jgi:hypothetical protein
MVSALAIEPFQCPKSVLLFNIKLEAPARAAPTLRQKEEKSFAKLFP